MDEKQIKAFIKAVEQLFGNPLEATQQEIEALDGQFHAETESAEVVLNLAARAAQKYRLAGIEVPAHVAEALKATKRVITGDTNESSGAGEIIDAALKPFPGPVTEVRCNFHNQKVRTRKDRLLLEELANEVKKDWARGKDQ
jgi:hypothetical protein